jgi:diguanylate cyclase (GGDEF)-like protein
MSEPAAPAPRSFRVSLKTKILLFVFVCVAVPLLAMGAYLLQQNEAVLGEKVRETVANHLFRKASELNDWLALRLSEAQRFTTSWAVWQGVDALTGSSQDPARSRRELHDYLRSVLVDFPVYESLFVVDLRGEVLASTRDGESLDEWGRQVIAGYRAETGGMVSPLFWSETHGRPTLLVVQPIQASATRQAPAGRVVGFFVQRLDLRELEALLAPPSEDLALSFWVVDEEGRVLVKAGKIAARPGEETFALFPTEAVPSGGLVREDDLPGLGRAVYGLRPLSGHLRASLVGLVPGEVAYRSLVDSRNRLLRYLVPILLGLFVVNLVATRKLLRPILLLFQGAKRVSSGDLDVYLPAWGSNEIADLTRAFNEMARKVRDGRRSLEEARDELARSNESLKAANRTLEALAITDGLTGLYNHRHFQESLEKEIRRCDREGRDLSLLLLDLDHFKEYNDRWGHTEGDAALRRVAGTIMKSIRSTDLAFRYGGEELAVLLPSCTKEQAVEVAEKIRVAVARAASRPGRFGGRTTVSIGVATFPEDGRVARGLFDTADAALYQAKALGRDRVALAAGGSPAKTESAG